ncbi:MAG: FAD-binding oxidoreductase [Thermodesulfobacteriota bacterium]
MLLSGWGRYPRVEAQGSFYETEDEAAALVSAGHPWIAHGAGGSYGDSALNREVIFTRHYHRLIDLDEGRGIIRCAAGMTLAEIIDRTLPRGWFLKVTPGTRKITVGGAIAADVHGKNHHQQGCFSSSVLSFRLMLPDGRIMTCGRQENPDLFRATCGGMGLTGLVLDAALRLVRVNSAFIRERTIRCRGLNEILENLEHHQAVPYSVAWVDCLEKNGRGLVMLGEHADDGDLSRPPPRSLSVPERFPSPLLNRFSVRLFNRLYFLAAGPSARTRRVSLDQFFYPLDRLDSWNRLYGPSGFIQYQFVLPDEAGTAGLRAVFGKMRDENVGPFLGVLKLFGPANDNPLSFPLKGCSLALDFPMHPRLFPFLDELDAIVIAHGGRHYLAKDARMKAGVFERGYPEAKNFRNIRQRYGLTEKINSLQSLRLHI